jgi:Mg2+/Co2+ transporter CorC|tara:strand:+ start:268 stop:420 length:153 start_codon:yes stop_codon:yes gene_type:complete
VDNYEFMNILKHLVKEKKDLQERLDMMEEILHSYLPVIGEDKKKETDDES